VLTCGKQLASVFWDTQGTLLVTWLPQCMTMNSNTCCDIVTCLHCRIQQQRKGKWAKKVFLMHDNAHPHSSKRARAQLDVLGYTVLPHPPYTPDLAPSDYALFDKMKEPLRGKTFTDAYALQEAVHQCCHSLAPGGHHEASTTMASMQRTAGRLHRPFLKLPHFCCVSLYFNQVTLNHF
jgi:histone-lysine N-methyltransferase SETMAR